MSLCSNIPSTEGDACIGKAWKGNECMENWSFRYNKIGILPSRTHVSTIVSLHHSDTNETPVVKARGELHKDAICYFEEILEAES